MKRFLLAYWPLLLALAGAVVYFCTAGKDMASGVISSLIGNKPTYNGPLPTSASPTIASALVAPDLVAPDVLALTDDPAGTPIFIPPALNT